MRRANLTDKIIFDADAQTIKSDGKEIHVFKKDVLVYKLLCLFCENPSMVLSKNTICMSVNGNEETEGDTRVVDLVCRLRKIIPKSLIQWRGNGYIYLGKGFTETELEESPKTSPKTPVRSADDILSKSASELDTPENLKRINDAKLWLNNDYLKKNHQFYFEDLSEMFQKRKSAFYDNRHKIDDFFVLPTISRDSDVENIHIKLTDSDLTVGKIIENSVDNCVIITGPVGSGKTALMSYLLMELINNHEAYREYFPIVYPINEYDFTKDFDENISAWLYKSGVRDDEAEEIPFTENCVYFIDNIDRLSPDDSEAFISSINEFVSVVAKESVFILFSRPFSDFEEYERFETFRIEPLNEEKANALISKLLKSHQDRIDESKTVISSLPAFCKTNPYILSFLLRLIIEKRLPVTFAERIEVVINSLIVGPDKKELNLCSGVSQDYFISFIQGVCEHLALVSNGFISEATLKNAVEFANTKRRPTKRLLKWISFDEFTFDMTRRTGLMIRSAGEYSFIDKTIVLWGCARSVLQQKSLYDLFYKEYPGKLDRIPEVFDYIEQFNHDKVVYDLFYGVLYDTFGSRCDKPYEKYIQAFHDTLFYYVGEFPQVESLNGASDIVKRGIIKEAGCLPDLGNILFPVYSDTDRIDYYLIDDEEALRMGIPRIACRADISNEYFSNHPELAVVGKKYSLSFSDLVLCAELRGELNKQQREQYNYLTNQSLPMYREFMAVMDFYESLLNSP
ncbi:MAG: winged helix-turn-helix domain-containing protein [Clostridiales bacterium]|nr:winged helix-turn-helix domain-containing protein [Clostridiales bacterium]